MWKWPIWPEDTAHQAQLHSADSGCFVTAPSRQSIRRLQRGNWALVGLLLYYYLINLDYYCYIYNINLDYYCYIYIILILIIIVIYIILILIIIVIYIIYSAPKVPLVFSIERRAAGPVPSDPQVAFGESEFL